VLLFFYLFSKSRYIPGVLAGLGFFASLIWTALYFANLVFPEHHTTFQYVSWPLMALADVTTVSGWHCLR
jgi:branched-subunit amino acid transport protein